jgi:hypothetical protein
MSHRQSWAGPPFPRKRAPNTILSAPADRSMGPYLSSLPSQLMKQWGQRQASISGRLLGLMCPYHQHEIGTFNTCSRGPTHWSLTDTGGGYNLRGAGFPHTTPRPSQLPISPFPKGLARSQIIQTTFINWTGEGTSPKSHEWKPPLDFYRNLLSKHSMI